MAALDLQGKKIGRLSVICREPRKPGDRNALWQCRCDCGKFAIVAASNLGRSQFSCGCLSRETAANLLRGNTHNKRHGMSGTPEYQAWTRMKLRCYNKDDPKYYRYGARGISVCERWRNSFDDFYADVGPKPSPKHSLGRIQNDGNYEPSNCRWETGFQQLRNFSRNRIVTIDDKSHCVSEWCEILEIPYGRPFDLSRLDKRYNSKPRFSSVEEALTAIYRAKFGAA